MNTMADVFIDRVCNILDVRARDHTTRSLRVYVLNLTDIRAEELLSAIFRHAVNNRVQRELSR